jgi:hypothetical protein
LVNFSKPFLVALKRSHKKRFTRNTHLKDGFLVPSYVCHWQLIIKAGHIDINIDYQIIKAEHIDIDTDIDCQLIIKPEHIDVDCQLIIKANFRIDFVEGRSTIEFTHHPSPLHPKSGTD